MLMKYAFHFILLKCLLWQIDDNIYLFGTVHSIPEQQFVWTPVLDSVLRSSEQVYFELDISRLSINHQPGYISYEDSIYHMYQLPTQGLETIEDQLAMMYSLPSASLQSTTPATDSTLYYFAQQDIYNLYRIVPYKDQVIDTRNRKWMSVINTVDKPTFIAVGASHLCTLLNMLRTSGHTVRPISIY